MAIFLTFAAPIRDIDRRPWDKLIYYSKSFIYLLRYVLSNFSIHRMGFVKYEFIEIYISIKLFLSVLFIYSFTFWCMKGSPLCWIILVLVIHYLYFTFLMTDLCDKLTQSSQLEILQSAWIVFFFVLLSNLFWFTFLRS